MMDWFKGFEGKPGEITFIDPDSDLEIHTMPMGMPNRTTQAERRRIFRTAQRSIVVNKRPYVRKIFLSGRWP